MPTWDIYARKCTCADVRKHLPTRARLNVPCERGATHLAWLQSMPSRAANPEGMPFRSFLPAWNAFSTKRNAKRSAGLYRKGRTVTCTSCGEGTFNLYRAKLAMHVSHCS